MESCDHTQNASDDKANKGSSLHNFLRKLAYPFAFVAGLFAVEREVNQAVYDNLKRFGAFDDLLKEGAGGGLEARNRANVQASNKGSISAEEFLARSKVTQIEYRTKAAERMAQKGLGRFSNPLNRWGYAGSVGRSEALLKGATWFGITAAVTLTLLDSKPLLKLLGVDTPEKSQEPSC